MNYNQAGTKTRSVSPVLLMLALAAAPAIGLGIARFSYALILPDMRTDLVWSWADAGWMNTSNALGYLAGALLAPKAIDRWGVSKPMLGGAIACVLSLALCAVLKDTTSLNIARILAGFGGGFAFVTGGVMATGVSARNPDRASFLLGLFYAGPGLGIAISGLVVPATLNQFSPGSWPVAWAFLAVISLMLIGALMLGLRADRGRYSHSGGGVNLIKMRLLLFGYTLFGAGYIAYMTFMIAWVRDGGGTVLEQSLFWAIIGVAAMISPWLWARILNRFRHGHAFALISLVTALGCALPIVSTGTISLYISGAMFGCAFFAVVASTTVFVRRNYDEAGWGRAISALTVCFGVGQTIGPIAIGTLNDAMNDLTSGLIASTVLLTMGAGIGFMQRDS